MRLSPPRLFTPPTCYHLPLHPTSALSGEHVGMHVWLYHVRMCGMCVRKRVRLLRLQWCLLLSRRRDSIYYINLHISYPQPYYLSQRPSREISFLLQQLEYIFHMPDAMYFYPFVLLHFTSSLPHSKNWSHLWGINWLHRLISI